MKIMICGGCQGCMNIEMNVIEACAQLNIDCDIVHVQDVREISKLGISGTPAIVVDGRVVFSGKVPGISELKRILGGNGNVS